MKLKDKALLVIEAIASDDELEGLALRPPEDKVALGLFKRLEDIYRYSHIAQNPSCIASHDDWVKDLKRIYTRWHKAGIF